MTNPIKHDATGLRLVGITTGDYDGTLHMSPFDRPNLRPWLTDPQKLTEYDGFIVAHFSVLGANAGGSSGVYQVVRCLRQDAYQRKTKL